MVKTEKESEADDVASSEETPASKGKHKGQGKKRKRSSSESSNEDDFVLADNALETERNVHISAMRNNLDETSARKILKTVVTNDHVLALVQLQEEAENSRTDDKSLQPKLTRAKVKELKKGSTNKSSAWDLERLELTPIKHIHVKTRPEVKALIAQELPDDEDDDEYEPTNDDVPSDDDHVESCSDLDSQPRTPATPARSEPESPRVVKDGPFKVPQDTVSARRKLEIEEEATIALRTRSKLSLSATSIEHIESTFVPPDDIPMQDVDDLWNEFLNECLNPASNAKNEDDDDADPEYNVAADPDAHDEDEESLSNSIIKISKKELNDLVTELFSILPGPEEETPKLPVVPSTHWEGKQEPLSDDESEQNTSKTDEIVQNPSMKLKFECPEEEPQSVSEESVSKNISIDKAATDQPSAKEQQSNQESENNTQSDQQSKNKTQSDQQTNTDQQVINKIQPDQQITNKTNADQESENKTGSNQQNGDGKLIAREIVEDVKEINIAPKIRPQKSRTPRLTISTVNNNIEISIEEEEPNLEQSTGSMGAPPSLLRKMKPAPETVHIQVDYSVTISPDQVLILQQQLRQHIQLATSNFMQTVVHPVHWKLAITFKDYLVSLTNMALNKEDSVTNVCNLKPAYELIHTWEKSVTEDTEQNRGMIEFLQEEAQKSRRRLRNNTLYGGQFHETFKEVVANSSVFLYPHLLPCMPYRPDTPRRFCYQRSEDTLITLGIDQFWQYVENNPAIYKPPRTKNPRGRPGFIATMELVTKHMFPWIAANRLASHVMAVRSGTDTDNPIHRYFKLNEMPKIEHSLLPFNPQLTLYEQPEHEVPRIWVRYLANNSKRFLSFLRKRSAIHVTRQPTGVKINGDATPETAKPPLPISFTKEIRSSRSTLNETTQPNLIDKFDVNIQVVNQQPTQQATQQTIPQQATNQQPQQIQNQVWVPQNFFKLVETSTGAYLVPFQVESETATKPPNTATSHSNAATVLVNTATGPITTAVEISTIIGNNLPEKRSDVTVSTKHCMCCVILRKICKQRQSTITEFFNKSVKNNTSEVNSKSEVECGCNRVSYQKISNRLRLLIKNHKKQSELVFKELEKRLKGGEITDAEEKGLDSKDIAHVLWYQLKVFTQASMSKRIHVKKRVNNLLSTFDTDSGSPIQLARDLSKVFDVELLDLYLDFLSFLTPEQADRMGVFKDYFTRNCAKDLMEKVEEQVTDKESRRNILNQLKSVFTAATDACETCAGLLGTMGGHPALARYTFNLFPHRKATRAPMYKMAVEPARITEDQDAINTTCDGPSVTMDYEADHSSSGEDNDAMSVDNEPAATSVPSPEPISHITISSVKTEPPAEDPVNSVATELDSSDYDESSLKIEETMDWTKEEDRSILQILQEYLTREERKDSYENDKSVIEMLEEKKVYILLYESLTNRSLEEIKERVLYLLTILVLSERDTS